MKNLVIAVLILFCVTMKSNSQQISPYLFGKNHWIATGDEGNRIGYMDLL